MGKRPLASRELPLLLAIDLRGLQDGGEEKSPCVDGKIRANIVGNERAINMRHVATNVEPG